MSFGMRMLQDDEMFLMQMMSGGFNTVSKCLSCSYRSTFRLLHSRTGMIWNWEGFGLRTGNTAACKRICMLQREVAMK